MVFFGRLNKSEFVGKTDMLTLETTTSSQPVNSIRTFDSFETQIL